MAGNFGGKIFWRIAEIVTFGKVLAIMIFIAKWLIERAENLTGSWASFGRLYQSDTETESRLPIFLGKWPATRPASVFTATAYTPFGLPSSHQQDISSLLVSKILWRRDASVRICWWWTPCLLLRWRIQLQANCTCRSYDYAKMMTSHCKILADEIFTDCS